MGWLHWPGPREVVAEAGLIPRHAVSSEAWVSEMKVGLAGRGREVRRQQRQRGLAAGLGLWPTRQERTVHGETVCVLVKWFSVATFSNDNSV